MPSARNQPNSHPSPPPKIPASNHVAAANTRLARKTYFSLSLSRRFRSIQSLAAAASTSAIFPLTIVGLRGSQLQTLVSSLHRSVAFQHLAGHAQGSKFRSARSSKKLACLDRTIGKLAARHGVTAWLPQPGVLPGCSLICTKSDRIRLCNQPTLLLMNAIASPTVTKHAVS
jgi:hypothetical protein